VPERVLVLGGTGTLGSPVVTSLAERGHVVRVLARNAEKARGMFGEGVEVFEGDSVSKNQIAKALAGCSAVHISLPTESELTAVRHLVDLAGEDAGSDLHRFSFVSGTSVREENRWFEVVDVKMRAEEILKESGLPHTVFCPTWVMEVIPNFIRPERAVIVAGKNPPGFHFFAADDFGRMVAKAYEDERSIGKRLFIHGPESFTLPEALGRFHHACHPQVKLRTLKVWQARLIAKLTRNPSFHSAAELIRYFDTTEEHGDPEEANTLLGAPATTLDEWIRHKKTEM